MKKIVFLIGIALLTMCSTLQAQDTPETECTQSHEDAFITMKIFLTYKSDKIKQHRVESGTNHIPLSQVSHVDDPIACARISTIILNSVPEFKGQLVYMDCTKFYYQTDEFYYIFGRFINTEDEVRISGPMQLFIIVNKESESIYKCYI